MCNPIRSDRIDWKNPDTTLLGFLGICFFLCCATLYYYLRFQFNLIFFIPILQYSVAYLLVLYVAARLLINGLTVFHTKVDMLMGLFVVHNLIFLPLSFYRYGAIEGLYSLKNFMTSLFLYFVVIVLLDSKRANTVIKVTTLLCTVVSLLYVMEMASIRYAPTNFPGHILNSQGPFSYTVQMDRHALEKAPEGHGVSKSWRKSERSMYMRIPGPLGHSSATALIMSIGIILSYSFILFGSGTWKKFSLFSCSACLIGLVWSSSRTNMLGAMAGIAIVSTFAVMLRYVRPSRIVIILMSATGLVALLMATSVIDLSAYTQVFNLHQTLYTFNEIFHPERLFSSFARLYENTFAFLFGYGLPPVFSSTFNSSRYSGVPFASDDSFYLQIFSQYGLLGTTAYLCGTVYALNNACRRFLKTDSSNINLYIPAVIGVIAVIAASFVSTAHAASAIRPQVSPVIFILLACCSILSRPPENQ